jgi:hypothetical protein
MINNKTLTLKTSIAATAFFIAGIANAAPVDLSSWLSDGPGNWTLQTQDEPNDSVFQSLNSGPSMFFNNMNSQGLALSGSIEVQESGGDDDFVGFVLGYNDNDLTADISDYILVDWKQGTQAGWDAGMSISRVTGAINTGGTNTGSDAWQHDGNVTFIERAATLGATGWVDNTSYLFDIAFTASNITVTVDGIQQFSINGSFNDGSFGFYNFSQPRVLYAGIQEDEAPPPPPPRNVSAPTNIALLGLGLVGLGFVRRRKT